MAMDENMPDSVNYWITSSTKHDCFFKVGKEPGKVERIGAVKILLLGHSEVFRNMLDQSALAETGDISVTDSDPDSFKHFLKCVYGGTDIVLSKLTFEECIRILYLCDKYLAFELLEKVSTCILKLHQPLSIDKALIALSNPVCLSSNFENLRNEVSYIIQNKTETIVHDKLFLNIDINAVDFIAQQERISITEVDLWKALLKWAQNKLDTDDTKNNLRSCFGQIIKLVRFCTMEAHEFCTHVVPSGVLTPEEVADICKSIGTSTAHNMKDLNNNMKNRFRKPKTKFTISYILNNIDQFDGTEDSKMIDCCDFKWYTQFRREEENLALYLYCKPSGQRPKSNWKLQVSVTMTLVNHYSNNDLSKRYDQIFCQKGSSWGYREFILWEKLLNPLNGYVKNNSIEVMTNVELDV